MMKWRNTSPWPKWFLRRMLAWIMREMEVPKTALRGVYFRKRTADYWSGRAFGSARRIVVSIGNGGYPARWSGYARACRPQDGSDYLTINDSTEALVITTAHELGHIRHFAAGHYGKGSEELADPPARMILRKFREQRAELVAAWSAIPQKTAERLARGKPSVVDKRAEKAAAMLARWERKMKLAKTKVSAWRRKVAYYEKKAAAR